MKNLVYIVIILASLKGWSQEGPNPNEVYVKNVTMGGSGCPASTARSVLSSDGKTLSILFDNYISEIDTAVSSLDHKSCLVTLDMNVPNGWTFSIASADYRGFAEVDPGTMAVQAVIYTFGQLLESDIPKNPGLGVISAFRKKIAAFSGRVIHGPFSGDYAFTKLRTVGEVPWSPCDTKMNRDLRINTTLITRAMGRQPKNSRRAMITLDTIDATFAQQFGLSWKKCN